LYKEIGNFGYENMGINKVLVGHCVALVLKMGK
jgi:hypothetical protein